MKKVLHISKYYYPFIGGTEQVARDFANALKEKLVEQKIICFNEDVKGDDYICKRSETMHDELDGIEVVRCGCFAKVASQSLSLSYHQELKQIMNDFRPDIIVFHYPNPFAAHFLLRYKKRDFKLVVYWHLDITKQKILGKLFHLQTLQLLKRADRIVATSPNYIQGSPYLKRFENKCTVVENCINTERMKINDDISTKACAIRTKYAGKTICFAVGRHVPYKGMVWLVRASKYLGDNFAVLIGGTGPLTDSIKEEAKDDPKIEFLGRISDKNLIAYFLASDIFCFPSITKNEAFGIALAEGMYFGKPAVTFTIPGSGVNYVNIHEVTGLECPNCDVKAYAEALQKLASDTKLRELYGAAARRRVLDNFTEEQFKNNLCKLIDTM